ncbi:MAG TPA: nucleotidyltransferase domain-containing protein [Candidatus Nitrosotenuis sp.]|nr:nucleotidyltransferase domain-containing protein [Candidatus Nitrosotenuis sp.]
MGGAWDGLNRRGRVVLPALPARGTGSAGIRSSRCRVPRRAGGGSRVSGRVVREAAARSRERLQEKLGEGLLGVRIYGSRARGDAGPESDLDLIVLVDREEARLPLIRTNRPDRARPAGWRRLRAGALGNPHLSLRRPGSGKPVPAAAPKSPGPQGRPKRFENSRPHGRTLPAPPLLRRRGPVPGAPQFLGVPLGDGL